MKTRIVILVCFWFLFGLAPSKAAQPQAFPTDSSTVVIDDIRFEASHYHLDATNQTATVVLSLLNQKTVPRELKINVYGVQVVDNNRNAYFFSSIELGRVLIRFEDKQNYLHYLLQPDTPVNLTVTAQGISTKADFIQLVKVVFEDSTEEGRFIETFLADIPAKE